MQLWKSIFSGIGWLALAACAREPESMTITSAKIVSDLLLAQIAWQPDANLLDALDHGIPLDFIVTVQAQKNAPFGWHTDVAEQQHRVQLRYYPLSRYYQLRDVDLDRTRSFPARASAIAALEDMRVPLKNWNPGGADRYRMDVRIDRASLPGVLRVSSLVRPAWWLNSGAFTWPAAAD
ncbi:MAG: DUF4390 domain-containing protein [Rudaea sp.]